MNKPAGLFLRAPTVKTSASTIHVMLSVVHLLFVPIPTHEILYPMRNIKASLSTRTNVPKPMAIPTIVQRIFLLWSIPKKRTAQLTPSFFNGYHCISFHNLLYWLVCICSLSFFLVIFLYFGNCLLLAFSKCSFYSGLPHLFFLCVFPNVPFVFPPGNPIAQARLVARGLFFLFLIYPNHFRHAYFLQRL